MRELFQQLIQEMERGETVAMATIIRRKGSVPREVGAKMLVHRGGKISGTVGGGCGEAEVWRSALNVIDTGRPTTGAGGFDRGDCDGKPGRVWRHLRCLHPALARYLFACSSRVCAIRSAAIDTALEGEQAIVLLTIVAAGSSVALLHRSTDARA